MIGAYDEEMKTKTDEKYQLDTELQKCIELLKQLEKDNSEMEAKKAREKKIADKWIAERKKFQLQQKRKEAAAAALFRNWMDHKLRVKVAKKKAKKGNRGK